MINDSQTIQPEDQDAASGNTAYLQRSEKGQLTPWDPRPNKQAWLASTLLHTAILLVIASLWKPVSNGTGSVIDRAAGIAIAHHKTSGTQYELQGGGSTASTTADSLSEALLSASASASSSAALDSSMQEMLGPLSSALSGIEVDGDAAGGVGNAGLSGQGSGGDTRGNASKTQTSFMGLEGQGSSFVYVVDHSESMSAYSGTPMLRAKQEIANSIQSLTRVNQFQIVFYNEQPTRYTGSISQTNGLIFANDLEKEAAANYVRRIEPIGGTEHYRALLTALAFSLTSSFF